jgi:hypothetical protein
VDIGLIKRCLVGKVLAKSSENAEKDLKGVQDA